MDANESLTEPRCKEITCSVSYGAKMQLVKYEYSEDVGYSETRKYDVPESWSEQEIVDYQRETELRLRAEIEPLIQADIDEMAKRRDELKGSLD